MATIRSFRAYRPRPDVAGRVAALPYDVYNRQEAEIEVKREPLSFLKVDRAETSFGPDVDTYAPCVYDKAGQLLQGMIDDGTYIMERRPVYYIYELIMDGRHQTGLVACSSIDDYMNGVIKKHENTREDKEIDRIKHVEACGAQTGPIFLAYRAIDKVDEIIDRVKKGDKLYGFTSPDGITHNVWIIDGQEDIDTIRAAFEGVDDIYIADGHHRAASAVKAGIHMREKNPGYTGDEEFNYFLSVLFPHDQLMIMPYNRVVKDLNGHDKQEFMDIMVVAQTTPGIFAIDMASHIGYKLKGVWGGIVGAIGIALPSIIAILIIAMFFQHFKDNYWVGKFFMGVRPAVVALIAAPCFKMAKTANINRYNIWIPVVCCLLIAAFGISPIYIIIAAGVLGWLYGKVKK